MKAAWTLLARRQKIRSINTRREQVVRIRAFVFEDDEVIRSVLRRLLQRRGYEVLASSEPGSCPLYLTDACPCPLNHVCGDIILSDIDMPGMTGLEFVQNQIKNGCKVKNIALMSGSWVYPDPQRAHELGCKIFCKPVAISEINKWLDDCEKKIDPNRILDDWFLKKASRSDKDASGLRKEGEMSDEDSGIRDC